MFQFVNEKRHNPSPRSVANSSLTNTGVHTKPGASDPTVFIKNVVVAFDVILFEPNTVFSFEDGLHHEFDVFREDFNNSDWDLNAQSRIVSCNAITAPRDTSADTTKDVAPNDVYSCCTT